MDEYENHGLLTWFGRDYMPPLGYGRGASATVTIDRQLRDAIEVLRSRYELPDSATDEQIIAMAVTKEARRAACVED